MNSVEAPGLTTRPVDPIAINLRRVTGRTVGHLNRHVAKKTV